MNPASMKPSEERIWMKWFPEEAKIIDIPECTAFEHMMRTNSDNMDGFALNYYGTKMTYRELARMVEDYARSFYALGVREGDMVSFMSLAVPECIASVYALDTLGATANMIDPRMDVGNISKMVLDSGSKIFVVLDATLEKVLPILPELKQEHVLIHRITRSLPTLLSILFKIKMPLKIPYGTHNITRWEDFISKGNGVEPVLAPYKGDNVVAVTYTGGTTGFPKGVMITNDSMNAVALNFQHWGIDHEAGQRFLGIIPIFSSYGMVCGMHMPLCMKQELRPIPKFDPNNFGKLIKKNRPQHVISTPAFIEMMMNSKEVRGLDMSFLLTLGSGGDTMNKGLESKLAEFSKEHNMKHPLAQGYGMSELSAAATFGVNEINKPGSVGIPSPTTVVAIFDPETGEELGYGKIGEVCVTGPSMMKGYWNNPEETENIMRPHADGRTWIHSGDLGYLDEEGFLFIKGRIKRMITRFDGHKVFPVNLEGMIMRHEGVKNCAVVGVRDRAHSMGHYPIALVEANPDVEDPKALCRELFDICNKEAEERGRPVAVMPIDAIPLTGMGKNDFMKLESEYKKFDYTQYKH